MLVFLRPRYWTRRRKFATIENKWQSLWAVLRPGASSNTTMPHNFNSGGNNLHRYRRGGGSSASSPQQGFFSSAWFSSPLSTRFQPPSTRFSWIFGANSTSTRDDDQDDLSFSVATPPNTGDSLQEQRPSNVNGVGNVVYDNELGDYVGASIHKTNTSDNDDGDHDDDGKLSIIDEVSSHHTAGVDLPASPHPDQKLPSAVLHHQSTADESDSNLSSCRSLTSSPSTT
jgi:hypothetical protein